MKRHQKLLLASPGLGVLCWIVAAIIGSTTSNLYRSGDVLRAETLRPIAVSFLIVGIIVLIPPVGYWLSIGLVAGWEITIKRTRGRGWAVLIIFILFGLIPLALWLIFMAGMGVSGIYGKRFAQNINPSKRQCVQCRGWSDYEAIRCRHCAQSLSDERHPIPLVESPVAV